MSDHPSRDALGRYREGDLPPAELLAIDAHLAQCAECRADGLASLDANRDLRAALASSHAAHLDYELLEAYSDGLLGADERDAVESHLSLCDTCNEDVGDLRRVRAEMSLEAASSPSPAESRWAPRWLPWRGAIGGLAALGAAAADRVVRGSEVRLRSGHRRGRLHRGGNCAAPPQAEGWCAVARRGCGREPWRPPARPPTGDAPARRSRTFERAARPVPRPRQSARACWRPDGECHRRTGVPSTRSCRHGGRIRPPHVPVDLSTGRIRLPRDGVRQPLR